MAVEFEWDSNKSIANERKHAVSFDEATDVFADPLSLTALDGWHSETELRWATIGRTRSQRLLVVFHTDRDDKIRIISARPPTTSERRMYEEDTSV
jgi:uncharacterized DUF497 family protein